MDAKTKVNLGIHSPGRAQGREEMRMEMRWGETVTTNELMYIWGENELAFGQRLNLLKRTAMYSQQEN